MLALRRVCVALTLALPYSHSSRVVMMMSSVFCVCVVWVAIAFPCVQCNAPAPSPAPEARHAELAAVEWRPTPHAKRAGPAGGVSSRQQLRVHGHRLLAPVVRPARPCEGMGDSLFPHRSTS